MIEWLKGKRADKAPVLTQEEIAKKIKSLDEAIKVWEETGDENPLGQEHYTRFLTERAELQKLQSDTSAGPTAH
jgi:hypothetical protein